MTRISFQWQNKLVILNFFNGDVYPECELCRFHKILLWRSWHPWADPRSPEHLVGQSQHRSTRMNRSDPVRPPTVWKLYSTINYARQFYKILAQKLKKSVLLQSNLWLTLSSRRRSWRRHRREECHMVWWNFLTLWFENLKRLKKTKLTII